MEILKIILCIVIGFAVSGFWFGVTFVCNRLLRKYKESWVIVLCPVLASIPILIFTALSIGFIPVKDDVDILVKTSGIAVLTTLISAIIISNKKQREHILGIKLLWWAIGGVFMEIPQRLMMQSIVYGILKCWEMPNIDLWAVICTALVWCVGIVIQNLIVKHPFDKEILLEIAASLVFSIGIGYTYQISGVIILPMIGHLFERIISNALLKN